MQYVCLIDLYNKGNLYWRMVLNSDPLPDPYVRFDFRRFGFFVLFFPSCKGVVFLEEQLLKWPWWQRERTVSCADRQRDVVLREEKMKPKRETCQDLFRCHIESFNENKHIRSLKLGWLRQASLRPVKQETPEVFTEIIQTVLQSIICPLQAIHHLATED